MNDIIFLGLNLLVNMNIIVNIVKQTFLKLSDKKLPLNSTIIMDLNQRPQRKKKLPLRFQNPSEIITSKTWKVIINLKRRKSKFVNQNR